MVCGTVLSGRIRTGDMLLIGPDSLGAFQPATIKSIHRRRMPTHVVIGGQSASFALKKIKRTSIRKGMVMVDPALSPVATWEFEGDITVLHHPTTMSTRYQAMVHCGTIRQTAAIVAMDKDHIRTGDTARATFRFIKNPEYLREGTRMVFREGRTKAVGTVRRLLPPDSGRKPRHTRGGAHAVPRSNGSVGC